MDLGYSDYYNSYFMVKGLYLGTYKLANRYLNTLGPGHLWWKPQKSSQKLWLKDRKKNSGWGSNFQKQNINVLFKCLTQSTYFSQLEPSSFHIFCNINSLKRQKFSFQTYQKPQIFIHSLFCLLLSLTEFL